MSSATIVIPCYNEALRLDVDAFGRFAAATAHNYIRLLLVNDGSIDATLARLNEIRAACPLQFDVLDLPQNCGKAEAVRRGVLRAVEQKVDYVGYWDADLAAPLSAIPNFVAALDAHPAALAAIGVRIPLAGRTIRRPASRRILGKTFSRLASIVLGTSLIDTQCGAKLFRATDEVVALFSQPFRARWVFDVEILARLAAQRRASCANPLAGVLYELPLDFWQDVVGSKLKKTDLVKALFDLGAIWWHEFRPGASSPQPHSVPE